MPNTVILLQLLCGLSLVGLAYVYVGYPLLMIALSRLAGRRSRKQPFRASVSVVIVAHNESRTLPAKLASLFAMDDSDQIREVLIGSDGSTDDMVAVLQQFPDRRVRVIEFPQRQGKPAGLNALLPQAVGEIVLFADARQEFHPAALNELLANFADPRVGVMSGELQFRSADNDSTAAAGIGFYWKYEKAIRRAEAAFRGVPGATGAIYAIRRELFRPIPPTTLLDDVAIPLKIVAQGYHCGFESAAIAYDRPAQSTEQESIRKRRTIAGVAQLLTFYPWWILPGGHPLWFEFLSHKVMRLASPLLLVTLAVASLCLLMSPAVIADPVLGSVVWALVGLQGLGYAAAGMAALGERLGRRSRWLGPCLVFLSLNWTTLLALGDAVRGRYRVVWKKA